MAAPPGVVEDMPGVEGAAGVVRVTSATTERPKSRKGPIVVGSAREADSSDSTGSPKTASQKGSVW